MTVLAKLESDSSGPYASHIWLGEGHSIGYLSICLWPNRYGDRRREMMREFMEFISDKINSDPEIIDALEKLDNKSSWPIGFILDRADG